MNILVVAHYQNDGSPTAIFVHDQVLAYRKLGHSVRVVVPIAFGKRDLNGRRQGIGVRWENIDGIPHYFIRHFSLSKYGKRRFNTAAALCTLRVGLGAVLDGFTPDVIHAHTLGFDSEIGAWLKRHLDVPLVVTTHGSDTTIPMSLGEHDQMKRLCNRADEIVAVSGVLRARLIPCGTDTPVRVIHNGFRSKHLRGQTPKNPCSFQQTSHLIELKKVDITIRAFARIHAVHPESRLTIIGTGVMRAELEALCGQLGVSEVVRFLGEVPNAQVFQELGQSQFYIMPSVREGLPISYLEAMGSGCITVGTAGEGISEIITSGENGFLVPPDDPDAIVQAVEWCFSHPDEAAAIAEQGRRDALGLTWEKNASEYIELFKSMRSKGGRL